MQNKDLSNKKSRLFIDLLVLEKGKSYGFQEYVFNLLNYFYKNRESILYDYIFIWCKDTELSLFDDYKDKFLLIGFSCKNNIKRHYLQSWLPFKYNFGGNDLLFSPGNVSGIFKRSPEILTIHDLLYKRAAWLPSKMMRIQRELLIPISINKANKVIAISNFTKRDIEGYYPKAVGKVEVVYNAMNFSKYDNIKQSLICDYFIAISTNYNYKNQRTIITAFSEYCKRGGNKKMLFVGRISPESEAGKEYDRLAQEVKDKVIFKSHITNEELGGLYKNASCFISASLFECLGMPVVEAMSFGLPVLLSDLDVHREVSMNKGIYFKPTDYDDLAEKMLKMDFSKRDYAEDIKERYSEDNTGAKYVEIINNMQLLVSSKNIKRR